MIKPTVGRLVHFHEAGIAKKPALEDQPLAAIIVYVHSDRRVNLAVFDRDGTMHCRASVFLKQGDSDTPPDSGYAEWMPYQKSAAAGGVPANEPVRPLPVKNPAPKRS